MRTDIRLNYSQLNNVEERIKEYKEALNDLKTTLNNLKIFLGEQESESVKKLKEKLDDVTIDAGDKKETLGQLETVLIDYIDDMHTLVSEVTKEKQTRVDPPDIAYNKEQILSTITAYDTKVSSSVSSGFYFQWGDDEEAVAKTEKLERNYTCLDNFRIDSLQPLCITLSSRMAEISDIYDKYLVEYETVDDEYRKKINAIYDDRTSTEDKVLNFLDDLGSVTAAFCKAFVIAFVSTLVIVMLPTGLLLAGLAVLVVGGVILANAPEESVPSWLQDAKKVADGTADKMVEVMEEGPGVLVDSIGQGLMDTVQTPEGIATVAGTATGTLAGGWAGKALKPKVKAKVKKLKKTKRIKGGSKATSSPYDLQATHTQTLSKSKMNKLTNEIQKNGIKDTIKYVEHNGQKYIVDGHHRAIAAKRLGIKEVPIEQVQLPYAGYNTIEDVLWFD